MVKVTTPASSTSPVSPEILDDPPWIRVRRVQLIRREIREYLPPAAIELLLQSAEHVFEGAPELSEASGSGPGGGQGRPGRIYGTAMTTIDLRRGATAFREPPDAVTAARVAELLTEHPVLRAKLVERVRAEMARVAGADPASLRIAIDFDVRAEDRTILIDADAVATVERR